MLLLLILYKVYRLQNKMSRELSARIKAHIFLPVKPFVSTHAKLWWLKLSIRQVMFEHLIVTVHWQLDIIRLNVFHAEA